MGVAAVIDRIDNLTMTERHGAIRSLTRKARVLVDPSSNPGNYSILELALQVLPLPFTVLGSDSNFPNSYSSLVLIERSASIAEMDPCCVDVILKYEHILDGPNQYFAGLPGTAAGPYVAGTLTTNRLYGKGHSSIVEKSTNFYYPNGNPLQADGKTPAQKVQILVGHVFSSTDTHAFAQSLPWWTTSYGKYAAVQGGEVTIPFPQSNYSLVGILAGVSNPWEITETIQCKINSTSWNNKPPFTWICSEAQFEVLDEFYGAYKFVFEFQYNIDTWNPTVVFNDQTTGRPPAKVQPATEVDPTIKPSPDPTFNSYMVNPNGTIPIGGVGPGETAIMPAGYWNVPALIAIDFNEFFGQFTDGASSPILS